MRTTQTLTRTVVICTLALVTRVPVSWAQDEELEVIPEELDQIDVAPDEATLTQDAEPWSYFLRVGLGAAFASSKRVIGNTDGNNWTLSLQLDAAADYFHNYHDLRFNMGITEAFSRTPIVDEFVKSADVFDLGAIYLYHIPSIPWFGPFARARMNTSLLPGKDVQPDNVVYQIAFLDGSTGFVDARTLELTDPFSPLTLKETVGVFFESTHVVQANVGVLLGFGARQTFADDQFAVTDDDTTEVLEVTELESFNQAGSELSVRVWGDIAESIVSYEASAEFMTPFINDLAESDDRSAFELTNIDLQFRLAIRPIEWFSIDYELKALREPQLLDDFQITNTLLLTLGYTLFEQTRE